MIKGNIGSSIFAAYGDATKYGDIIQMSTLDAGNLFPFTEYPLITIYNSTEPRAVQYANIGFVGIVGVLAGYNAEKIGIGEKFNP